MIDSPDLVDVCIEELNKQTHNAIAISVPKRKIRPSVIPFSTEIKTMIRERNRIRNKYKLSYDSHDKSRVNILNRMIRKKSAELRKTHLENIDGALKVQDNSIPPLIGSVAKRLCYSDPDKAQAFADAFHSYHTITTSFFSPHEARVAESIAKFYGIKMQSDNVASDIQDSELYRRHTKARIRGGPTSEYSDLTGAKRPQCQKTFFGP